MKDVNLKKRYQLHTRNAAWLLLLKDYQNTFKNS